MTTPNRYEGCGHGHVYPTEDGTKARCGGPAICSACASDLAHRDRINRPVLADVVAALDTDPRTVNVQSKVSKSEADALDALVERLKATGANASRSSLLRVAMLRTL